MTALEKFAYDLHQRINAVLPCVIVKSRTHQFDNSGVVELKLRPLGITSTPLYIDIGMVERQYIELPSQFLSQYTDYVIREWTAYRLKEAKL